MLSRQMKRAKMAGTRVEPDLIHIGYMRAGSTFLRSYFSHHPQICWTRRAWYFQHGESDNERRRNYPRLLPAARDGGAVIDMYESLCLGQYFATPPQRDVTRQEGPEWSADWAVRPGSPLDESPIDVDIPEVARRISACVPTARVLIVLRNQIDWLQSMFRHYIPHLPPGGWRPEVFFSTVEGKCALHAAQFDQTLRTYFETFGRDRVHVMILEELAEAEQVALRRLCEFIGVEFVPHDPSRAERNQGRADVCGAASRWGRLRLRLTKLSGRTPYRFSESLRSQFASMYAVSNRQTSRLLELDLSRWGYSV